MADASRWSHVRQGNMALGIEDVVCICIRSNIVEKVRHWLYVALVPPRGGRSIKVIIFK